MIKFSRARVDSGVEIPGNGPDLSSDLYQANPRSALLSLALGLIPIGVASMDVDPEGVSSQSEGLPNEMRDALDYRFIIAEQPQRG